MRPGSSPLLCITCSLDEATAAALARHAAAATQTRADIMPRAIAAELRVREAAEMVIARARSRALTDAVRRAKGHLRP